ncbi:MAG: hypothetical protein Q8914_07800, partial [Bacteroidota bacterium]|nr:hypothetical protein [Bacteroidota bacterium]
MAHSIIRFVGCFFLLLTAFALSDCDSEYTTIPDREVYLRRDIDVIKLNAPGTYKSFTKAELTSDRLGFGGLMVVHAFNGEY